MEDQFLRSMVSAEHWRHGATNCKFLLLTLTGRGVPLLQLTRRSILMEFASATSLVPCLDDCIGPRHWAERLLTKLANWTLCTFIQCFCGRPGPPRARQKTRAFLTCYRRGGCWLKT